ncbi:unnamed protein product [Blepharisma stoltei]|uniref:Uncharacterized protein n=1 Tax=Blepharisma stoltei TaxID=1481888 RepID=A0AAU9JYM5_9CILI|nr:unnamed protein product [Blepharisma stoltei]
MITTCRTLAIIPIKITAWDSARILANSIIYICIKASCITFSTLIRIILASFIIAFFITFIVLQHTFCASRSTITVCSIITTVSEIASWVANSIINHKWVTAISTGIVITVSEVKITVSIIANIITFSIT